MRSYAQNTTVSLSTTQEQIKALLRKHGGDEFVIGESKTEGAIVFTLDNLRIRMALPMPDLHDFDLDGRGSLRSDNAKEIAREKEVKRLWRAMMLAIKSKLVIVENKISTMEREFLAHVVMGNGQTIGDFVVPKIPELTLHNGQPQQKLLANLGA